VHFILLLAVCWPGAQSAWDNYALACNINTCNINTRRLSNKPFLVGLLRTSPNLTLSCNLSLMDCFADINVSEGSIYAKCTGIFNIHLTANLARSLTVNFFYQSVKIWQKYGQESLVAPFWHTPYSTLCGNKRDFADLITYISTRSTWTPHGSVPSSNTCCKHTRTTNVSFECIYGGRWKCTTWKWRTNF